MKEKYDCWFLKKLQKINSLNIQIDNRVFINEKFDVQKKKKKHLNHSWKTIKIKTDFSQCYKYAFESEIS